ncbi:MAG TPA: 50S ribosomal protein L14e [Candidatus Aenigmarchaeota archaeon]|nr:MAG: 50S ribosomal protein L14e [Candidatus Aenigmarchaeota archaeon]HDD45933.1 50S ribosomal protein L14e [Candidatus Aenigmarchaeota archaeon]
MFEIGRMCVKTAGREAGKYCVVVDTVDKDFVIVTGPKLVTGVKRRRCNKRHLEPIPIKISINKGASDEDIMKAYEKEGVYEKLKIEKPKIEGKEKEKKEVKKEGGKEKKEKPEKKASKKSSAKAKKEGKAKK